MSQAPLPADPDPAAPGTQDPASGTQARGRDQSGLIAGVVVAGIGVSLLFGQVMQDTGRWIPLIVGLIFLAAFAVRREYGFLVPGSIITGIGVGTLLAGAVSSDIEGAVVLLSLAGGFVGIWVLGALFRLPQNHWWPFIPGGILAMVGMVQLADADVDGMTRWWPLMLVFIGLLIVGRAFVRGRA